jgi:MinD superfamily P-loop ATPase
LKKGVITVASGKGGTGKTTIACCLALSAQQPVQFLDCDVEEPNAHIFLKPDWNASEVASLKVPEVDYSKCTFCGKCADICMFNALAVVPGQILTFPELCHSCGGCWTLCPEKAIRSVPREIGIIEKGDARDISFIRGKLKVGTATSPPLIKAVKGTIQREGLAILDAPPGTSCPVVETMEESDFILLVTEPTVMGLNDLSLALEVVRLLNIPCGVVINRCTDVISKVEKFCRESSIPVVAKIPVNRDIAKAYATGIPPVKVNPELTEKFTAILNHIERVTTGERTCCH